MDTSPLDSSPASPADIVSPSGKGALKMPRELPPAIPLPSPIPQPFFYMGRGNPFEDMEREKLKPTRGHFFKAPLPDQLDLWEVVDG